MEGYKQSISESLTRVIRNDKDRSVELSSAECDRSSWEEHANGGTLMNKATMVLLLLMGGGWLMAQAKSDRSANDKQGQVTVQGCVRRSSGTYAV